MLGTAPASTAGAHEYAINKRGQGMADPFIRHNVDIRSWSSRAACRPTPGSGLDPSLWHPDEKTSAGDPGIRKALRICGSCPVREECLEHAIKFEPYGIWGGTRERERDYLRQQRGQRGVFRLRRKTAPVSQ